MKRNAYLPECPAIAADIIVMTPSGVIEYEPVRAKKTDDVFSDPVINPSRHFIKPGPVLALQYSNCRM